MSSKPIPEGKIIHGAITKHLDRRFLSSIDLAGQGVIEMTIDHVSKHDVLKYENGQSDKNAILLHFKEVQRPLKLNATNIKAIIISTETNKVDDWAGCKIRLQAEEGVYFGKRGLAVRVVVD